jgi:hypothetical protein
MKTIYIALTSLDDSELIPTVLGAFEKAANPESIFVGVHLWSEPSLRDEFVEKLALYAKNIRFKFTEMSKDNFKEMTGVGRGRRRALNLYNNEDYLLQIDSHSLFEKDWDKTLIDTLEEAKAFVNNQKTIITAYSGFYKFSALGKRVWCHPDNNSGKFAGNFQYPYYVSNKRYYGAIPAWTVLLEEEIEGFPGKFMPAVKFNANFAFGDSDWAKNTGLYEDAEFFEEEVLQTLNLIKLGYTIVFPKMKDSVIGHLYTDFISGNYGKRKSMGDYVDFDYDYADAKGVKNYQEYILDPENSSVIKEYSKYARVHMKFGPLDANPHVPKYFINSEVSYDY